MDPLETLNNYLSSLSDVVESISAFRQWRGAAPEILLRRIHDDSHFKFEVIYIGFNAIHVSYKSGGDEILISSLRVKVSEKYGLVFEDEKNVEFVVGDE